MSRVVLLALMLTAAQIALAAKEKQLTVNPMCDASCTTCNDKSKSNFAEGCKKVRDKVYRNVVCDNNGWTVSYHTDDPCTNTGRGTPLFMNMSGVNGCQKLIRSGKIRLPSYSENINLDLCGLYPQARDCSTEVNNNKCTAVSMSPSDVCASVTVKGETLYYTASKSNSQATVALYYTQDDCTKDQYSLFKATEKGDEQCADYEEQVKAECAEPPRTRTKTITLVPTTTTTTTESNNTTESTSTTDNSTSGATTNETTTGGSGATSGGNDATTGGNGATTNDTDGNGTTNDILGSAATAVTCAVILLVVSVVFAF